MADITVVPSVLDDWTAVAQNVIVKGTEDDFSNNLQSTLIIQAVLDTTTAHTGTRFIVQIAGASSGNEDWVDYFEITGLIDTAATDLIEDNPLSQGATTITLTGHALTEEGIWLFIEDGTLTDSEIVFLKSQSTDQLVLLDGTANEHAQSVAIFNVVMTQAIQIPMSVGRIRVIVDNTVDPDGSSMNFKITVSEATELA